jgi:hypothetical protein
MGQNLLSACAFSFRAWVREVCSFHIAERYLETAKDDLKEIYFFSMPMYPEAGLTMRICPCDGRPTVHPLHRRGNIKSGIQFPGVSAWPAIAARTIYVGFMLYTFMSAAIQGHLSISPTLSSELTSYSLSIMPYASTRLAFPRIAQSSSLNSVLQVPDRTSSLQVHISPHLVAHFMTLFASCPSKCL